MAIKAGGPTAPPAPPPDISVPGLKARGWTDALIRDHLGAHDRERPNPRFKSAAPMKLYDLARVEAVEQREDWAAHREKAGKRSASATAAADRKRQALLAAIDALVLDVPLRPLDLLFTRACAHYNIRQEERRMQRWERGGFEECDADEHGPANLDSRPDFLQRITVNYLRHQLTGYENELAATFGKVGVREAYLEINAKVYDAIGVAYPALADECARQLQRKRDEHEHEHMVGIAEAHFAERRAAIEQKNQKRNDNPEEAKTE